MDTRFPDIPRFVWALLIVGVVVVLILHSIWKAGDAVYQGDLEQDASTEIHNIIEGFRRLYQGHVSDPAGTNLVPLAIQSGICTSAMVKPDVTNYCVGPWGKNNWILMTSNAGLKDYDNSINIFITGLNRDACVNLAMAFGTNNPGLLHVLINKTENILVGPGDTTPFTATDIEKACNRSSSQNSLLITYRIL